jgi:hypothetical protein
MVGSKTSNQAATAIPTALVDHGKEIATATASKSVSRKKDERSKLENLVIRYAQTPLRKADQELWKLHGPSNVLMP